VLRAVDGSGNELSTQGLIKDLADPGARDEIRFTTLDPANGHWRTLAYPEMDQTFRDNLARYMSADKTIVVLNGGQG
jgi:hypothetical protein